MNPIFLIGYMGSGKSTIGRKLASELGLQFIDTDIFIEARFRQRVGDMFDTVGETVFRRRERVVIEELSGMQDCVIATGGGLPCHSDNMELLGSSGLTIYLSASDEALCERLELCKRTRPTIRHKSGQELLAHIREAMQARRPIYSRARLIQTVEHLATSEDETRLAQELAQKLRNLGSW